VRIRTAIEPAHPQNRSGELPSRLLAGSNSEIGQEAGIRTRTVRFSTLCVNSQ
jgi:hypothetical protein